MVMTVLLGCSFQVKDNYDVSSYIRENCSQNKEIAKAKTNVQEYKNSELNDYGLTDANFTAINTINENEEYYTRYIKYETDGGIDELNNYGQYDRQLYPGAIVDISTPSIGDIYLKPSSRTLSISLETTTSDQSYRPYIVKNTCLSETRVGVNKLVNMTLNQIAKIPTKLSMQIESVTNSDELKIALGIDINSNVLNINEKFSYETFNSSKSIILKLKQVYYTIDVDSKTAPSLYFDDSLSNEQIKNGLKGTVPAIVTSVQYGRIAIVKLTSNDSLSTIANSLESNVSYKGIDAEICNNIQSKINSGKINSEILVYGGTLENGSPIGTNISFKEMIEEFSKEYSPDVAAAVPIAYKLNYISDGRQAKILMTNEPTYIKVHCPRYSVLDLEVNKMEILDHNKNKVNSSLWFKADDYIADFRCGAQYISKDSIGNIIDKKVTKKDSTETNDDEPYLAPYYVNQIRSADNGFDFTNYMLSIYAIDNSKIAKNDYQSLIVHINFKIKTDRSTWLNEIYSSLFFGGSGFVITGDTASVNLQSEIKNFDTFTSVDGFYVDFSTASNGGIFRVYFKCELK